MLLGFNLMKHQVKCITCWKEKIAEELCGGIRIIEKKFLYYSIMGYKILKRMVLEDQELFVLMNDGHGEILYFDTEEEAQAMVNILNANTDSGWKYEIY